MKHESLARANAQLRKFVRYVHTSIDEHHAKPVLNHPDVRCSDGCAYAPLGCCSLLTIAEVSEAEYIIDRNADTVRRVLPALIEAVRRIESSLPRDVVSRMCSDPGAERLYAAEYHRANIVCPFLGDDRRCTIYEDRPVACRTHFVLSDPVECRAIGSNENYVVLDKGTRLGAQEMIMRGVARLRGGRLTFGTLPQLVLWAWRNREVGGV